MAGERRLLAGAGRRRVRLPASRTTSRRGLAHASAAALGAGPLRAARPGVPSRVAEPGGRGPAHVARRPRRASRAADVGVALALLADRRAATSTPASTRRPLVAAEAAVRADPLLAPAYVVLGQARSTLGEDAAAVDPLRKAVYLDPTAGHAHFLLAGALARLGPASAARRVVPRCCRVAAAPDDATPHATCSAVATWPSWSTCAVAGRERGLPRGGVPARRPEEVRERLRDVS